MDYMMDCNCHHCLFKKKGKSICLQCTLSWRKEGYTNTLLLFVSSLGLDVAKLVLEYLKFRNSCTFNCPMNIPRQACPGCRKALSVRTTRRVKIPRSYLFLFTHCEQEYKWAETIHSTYSDKKLCRKCYRYEKMLNGYDQKPMPFRVWELMWEQTDCDIEYGWYMGNGEWTDTLNLL